jgi:hypothetical protein
MGKMAANCTRCHVTPSEQYSVTRLQRDQIEQAYPLLQSRDGGFSLDKWRSYAARLTNAEHAVPNCGIIVAESPLRYLRGMFSYYVGPHLSDGERIVINSFVVVDTIDRSKVAMVLVDAIPPLVSDLHCTKVALHLDAHDAWLVPLLYAAGFEQHGSEMVQILGCKFGG